MQLKMIKCMILDLQVKMMRNTIRISNYIHKHAAGYNTYLHSYIHIYVHKQPVMCTVVAIHTALYGCSYVQYMW